MLEASLIVDPSLAPAKSSSSVTRSALTLVSMPEGPELEICSLMTTLARPGIVTVVLGADDSG